MAEKSIQSAIFQEVNQLHNARLFRNNIGQGWVGQIVGEPGVTVTLKNYRPIRFGLRVGSGDLIGWTSVKIIPAMVDKTISIFTSVETKTPVGRVDPDQLNWADQVRIFGGISGVARSVPEALAIINPLIIGI